jgi:hypothetical protein
MTIKQITIDTLVGAEPFYIYLCDGSYLNCMYITTIYNTDIPYTFLIPSPYLSLSQVGVKAVDSNGCNIINTINI